MFLVCWERLESDLSEANTHLFMFIHVYSGKSCNTVKGWLYVWLFGTTGKPFSLVSSRFHSIVDSFALFFFMIDKCIAGP